MQELVEAPEELPTGEVRGERGKEAGEEPQKLILHPIPINLDPSATARPKNNPLPVHILVTPAPHATPEIPTVKAIPFTLPALQNLKMLVAFVQTFATTSKTLAVAHTAWHRGWFGCWFKHGAPGPRHFRKVHQFQQPPNARETGLGGAQSSPLFVLIFIVLFYFIKFYFDFFNFSFRFSLIFS